MLFIPQQPYGTHKANMFPYTTLFRSLRPIVDSFTQRKPRPQSARFITDYMTRVCYFFCTGIFASIHVILSQGRDANPVPNNTC